MRRRPALLRVLWKSGPYTAVRTFSFWRKLAGFGVNLATTAAEYQTIIDAIDAAILNYYQNGGVIEYDIDGRRVRRDLSGAQRDRAKYVALLSATQGTARNYAAFER